MPWRPTGFTPDAFDHPTTVVPIAVDAISLILIALDGRWYAIEDRCSHAGCSFIDDGEIEGFRAICDCHGSEFDIRTGRAVHPPALEPIATFPVRTIAGMIEVEV